MLIKNSSIRKLVSVNILTIFLSLFSVNAEAATVTVGNGFITDVDKATDFLRLDTAGLAGNSWNDLNANGFDALGSNWRLATAVQVVDLWNDLAPGRNFTVSQSIGTAGDSDVAGALQLLGLSSGSSSKDSANGWIADPAGNKAFTALIFDRKPTADLVDFWSNKKTKQLKTFSSSIFSAWMVRDTLTTTEPPIQTISTVPLPASLPLFASGIAGMLLVRRRLQNTA